MQKYFLGTSGYFYWHWQKRFYPEDMQPYKWLEFYAKHFSTVEINSTYYHFPKQSSVKAWQRKVPKDFVFSVKGNKAITHMKKFSNSERLVKDFYSIVSVLGGQLACVLWQLPPFMKFNERKLAQILGQMDSRYKNVLEFRNESWFCDETFDALKKAGVAFCCVSVGDLPATCIATAPFAYVRFHGSGKRYSSDYSTAELRAWVTKIRKLKAKEVYCYFNNDDNAHAVKNCMQLRKMLQK